MTRPLLVLDLDETLIYASEQPLERAPDFTTGRYFVYRRPGVEAFLRACDAAFEFAVWTAATASYAESVVQQLFPSDVALSFVWSRERCTPRYEPNYERYEWLKNLSKLKRKGYRLERVVVVDDTPMNLARHYGNLVTVQPFFGNVHDQELSLLARYLPTLAGLENVRCIEKRFWRECVFDESLNPFSRSTNCTQAGALPISWDT